MSAPKGTPAGLKTPLLRRPAGLSIPPDSDIKAKSDASSSSPRVGDSRAVGGLGLSDVETPLRAGPRIASPTPKRSGGGGDPVPPTPRSPQFNGKKFEKQKAESVKALSNVFTRYSKMAAHETTREAADAAIAAMQTTPGKPPKYKIVGKITGWRETALAQKTKNDEIVRAMQQQESTPEEDMERFGLTLLGGLIPRELDEPPATPDRFNNDNYASALRPKSPRPTLAMHGYDGDRPAHHFFFLREVAVETVRQWKQEGKSLVDANATITQLLRRVKKGGELWAHLIILRKAINNAPEPVNFEDLFEEPVFIAGSGSADGPPVNRQLFDVGPAEPEPAAAAAASPKGDSALDELERRQKRLAEVRDRLQDFEHQVQKIGEWMIPQSQAFSDAVQDVVRAYSQISGLLREEHFHERDALTVQLVLLGKHFRKWLPTLTGDPAAQVTAAMAALGIPPDWPTTLAPLLIHGERLLDSVMLRSLTNTRGNGHIFFSQWREAMDKLVDPLTPVSSKDSIAVDVLAELFYKNRNAVESLLPTFSDDDLTDILSIPSTGLVGLDVLGAFIDAVVAEQSARAVPEGLPPRAVNPIVKNLRDVVARFADASGPAIPADISREEANDAYDRFVRPFAAEAMQVLDSADYFAVAQLSYADRQEISAVATQLGISEAVQKILVPPAPQPASGINRYRDVPASSALPVELVEGAAVPEVPSPGSAFPPGWKPSVAADQPTPPLTRTLSSAAANVRAAAVNMEVAQFGGDDEPSDADFARRANDETAPWNKKGQKPIVADDGSD